MGRQLDIEEPDKIFSAVDLAFGLGFNKDLAKAKNGNKAAARRCRKEFLTLQKACISARMELMTIIKNK